ncbi:MAG: hypothetical protein U5K76_08210 [Woeseiaceae bacterium]|nr:hypothetical protein [Woeseiaceae bacterium]
MSRTPDTSKPDTGNSEFAPRVGPPLAPGVRGGSLHPPADENAVQCAGRRPVSRCWCAPERSGKSSLFAATAARLRNQGFRAN